MSFSTMLLAGAGSIVAIFSAVFARMMYKNLKDDRDRIQDAHDAIIAAGNRLETLRKEAAQKANQQPIDPKKRNEFEKQS